MKVLVTGAAGYLGSRVAIRLVGRGEDVTGLVRRPGSAPDGVAEIVGDLDDVQLVGRLASEADAIVHTAFGHDADFADAVAVEKATVDAIMAAAAAKPVVLTSAAGVLGDTGARPAPDDAAISPDFPARIRGFIEERVRAAPSTARMMALRLPVIVHGHGGSQFAPLYVAAAARDGTSRYVGAGYNRLSAVHVDDAADAYLTVLDRGRPGHVYNVAAETVTARQFAEAVAAGAGVVRVESVQLQDMQDATHPFAALLTSMTFDLDASGLRTLGWSPSGPSMAVDVGSGSYGGVK